MTTQADIKLVIDQLNNLEEVHGYDENVTDDAAQMLAALGNQIAAQAAVIEKLRGALKFYANPASDTFGNTARLALDTPTDSTQILREWLDSVLGEPYLELCLGTPLYRKPEIINDSLVLQEVSKTSC